MINRQLNLQKCWITHFFFGECWITHFKTTICKQTYYKSNRKDKNLPSTWFTNEQIFNKISNIYKCKINLIVLFILRMLYIGKCWIFGNIAKYLGILAISCSKMFIKKNGVEKKNFVVHHGWIPQDMVAFLTNRWHN